MDFIRNCYLNTQKQDLWYYFLVLCGVILIFAILYFLWRLTPRAKKYYAKKDEEERRYLEEQHKLNEKLFGKTMAETLRTEEHLKRELDKCWPW